MVYIFHIVDHHDTDRIELYSIRRHIILDLRNGVYGELATNDEIETLEFTSSVILNCGMELKIYTKEIR